MSKRRVAGILLAGLLLGFFAGVAALSLGRQPERAARALAPLDAGAAAVSASSAMSTHYGTLQAHAHSALISTAPIVPFIHTLQLGMKGCKCATVFQLQRALKAAGVRPHGVRSTGYYGPQTAKQVAAFQRKAHIKPASGRYGLRTHRALSKFYDRAGRARLIAVAKSRRLSAVIHGLVTVAFHTKAVGGNTLAYSEGPSRGILPRYPKVPPATDCSGMVEYWYRSVGLPDPSGLNFSPVGWTGTIGKHGVVVPASAARPGDLALYGGGYPFGHVAMVVSIHPTMVMSHGSVGVKLLPIGYRPLSQLRRFF